MSGYNYSLFGSPIYKLHVQDVYLPLALPLMLPLSSDHGRQSLFDLKRPLRGVVKAAGARAGEGKVVGLPPSALRPPKSHPRQKACFSLK